MQTNAVPTQTTGWWPLCCKCPSGVVTTPAFYTGLTAIRQVLKTYVRRAFIATPHAPCTFAYVFIYIYIYLCLHKVDASGLFLEDVFVKLSLVGDFRSICVVHLVPHLSWFGLPDVYKKRLSVRSCSKSIRGLPLAPLESGWSRRTTPGSRDPGVLHRGELKSAIRQVLKTYPGVLHRGVTYLCCMYVKYVCEVCYVMYVCMYLCIYVYMYLKTAPLRSSLGTSDGSFRPVIERMRSPTCIVLNVPATNSLNAQATPSKRIPHVSMYRMYFYSFSSSLKHLICQVPLFFCDSCISSLRNCFIINFHSLVSALTFSLLGDFLATFSDFTSTFSFLGDFLASFSFFDCRIIFLIAAFHFSHSSISALSSSSKNLWMLTGIAFGTGMMILRSVMYFLDALLDELLISKANYAQNTARASCEQERMHVCMYVCMHACMHADMYLCMYVCMCMYVCIWRPVWCQPNMH